MKDLYIDIATANSRKARQWRNAKMSWTDFAERCARATRTPETVAEYAAMSRDRQSEVKDVGGFVGGYLRDGKRKSDHVVNRSMLTLDIDRGKPDLWQSIITELPGIACVVYSTHKHKPETPRYRLCIPLSHNITPELYEPLARRVAAILGIDQFDSTTYETARLFYWPSVSIDGEFYYRRQDGNPLDEDEWLGTYLDPLDSSEWPIASSEVETLRHELTKLGDPRDKSGLIGMFCQAYSIEDVIDTYLREIYTPTATPGRYTYARGTVAGGLVIYNDGQLAYSNHESDPAGKHCCNAFDLVRIHRFGHLDNAANADDPTKLRSYKEMLGLAANDPKVKRLIARQAQKTAEGLADFADSEDESAPDSGDDWVTMLEIDRRGNYEPSAKNLDLILENDPRLAGHFWLDMFSGFCMFRGDAPWARRRENDYWTDTDEGGLRLYIEKAWGIQARDKLRDVRNEVCARHRRHPVREYLNGLQWDGIERLDRLFIDYFGAPDTELIRTMTRKQFVGAVRRVFEPGCQHDYCLVLAGPEGIGKSTLLRTMGEPWFNESMQNFEGKDAMENLRKSWIVELGELKQIRRADEQTVKNFLTRREDTYRAAYARETEPVPRQCVFFGTTNEGQFLKGLDGNRRFWVVPCRDTEPTKQIADLANERDQLWAEAVARYRQGETSYLCARLEKEARAMQDEYNEELEGELFVSLRLYLETPIPADWPQRNLFERRAYYNELTEESQREGTLRYRFKPREFISEMFPDVDRDPGRKSALVRAVNTYMGKCQEWEKDPTHTGGRGWRRKV